MQQIFTAAQVDAKDYSLTLKTSPQGEAKTKWYLIKRLRGREEKKKETTTQHTGNL